MDENTRAFAWPCVAFLLLLLSASTRAEWIDCQLGGVSSSMTQARPALQGQSNAGTEGWSIRPHEWTVIDVTDKVPPETRCVHLVGTLMITGGNTAQICDNLIGFREYGHPTGHSRGAQTVTNGVHGSARTNFSRWVPVVSVEDRLVFEALWEVYNVGSFPRAEFSPDRLWPEFCSVGVVAWIDAWGW